MIRSIEMEKSKNVEQSLYFFDLKYKVTSVGKKIDNTSPSNLVAIANDDTDVQKSLTLVFV